MCGEKGDFNSWARFSMKFVSLEFFRCEKGTLPTETYIVSLPPHFCA